MADGRGAIEIIEDRARLYQLIDGGRDQFGHGPGQRPGALVVGHDDEEVGARRAGFRVAARIVGHV